MPKVLLIAVFLLAVASAATVASAPPSSHRSRPNYSPPQPRLEEDSPRETSPPPSGATFTTPEDDSPPPPPPSLSTPTLPANCSSHVVALSECLAYISPYPRATEPASPCCKVWSSFPSGSLRCFCELLGNHVRFPLNKTMTLSLYHLCPLRLQTNFSLEFLCAGSTDTASRPCCRVLSVFQSRSFPCLCSILERSDFLNKAKILSLSDLCLCSGYDNFQPPSSAARDHPKAHSSVNVSVLASSDEELRKERAVRIQYPIGIVGAILSLLYFALPGISFLASGVGQQTVYPFLVGLANCVIGLLYCLPVMTGKRPHGWLLITVYAAGTAVESIYIAVFFCLSQNQNRRRIAIITVGMLTVLGVFASLLLLASLNIRTIILGTALALSGVMTNAYPCLILRQVMESQSVEAMSPLQILTGLISSLIWLIYACVGVPLNLFFLVANAISTSAGTLLFAFYCVYYVIEKRNQAAGHP